MKKLFIGLAFLGFLSLAFPAKAIPAVPEVQPCHTYKMTCISSGKSYYVIACSEEDKLFWAQYYCGCDCN